MAAKKKAAKKKSAASKKAAKKAPKKAAKKAAPKKAAKKAAPKKAAKKAAPKKAAPKKAAPKKAAPKKAAPKKAEPKKAAPAPKPVAAAAGGRFVWHDLMTTDVEKARGFYASLLPWKTRPVEMQPLGVTQRIEAGGAEVGGLVSLPSSEGISSHWMPYVMVKDIDAVVQKARDLGGYVPVPPTKLEGVGRFAVIADPRGAHVSPIQLERQMDGGGAPQPGHVTWNEVHTDDVGATARFFAGVFGWKLKEEDMGPMGKYTIFLDGEAQVGGAMKAPMEGAQPQWLSYWAVNDINRTVERAKQSGGQLLGEVVDIPNIGKVAMMIDPTGAPFALHQQ